MVGGGREFGGLPLTAALLACMFVRQVNFAAIYTLFCFGHERRLAITGVADGVAGVLFMLALSRGWVRWAPHSG